MKGKGYFMCLLLKFNTSAFHGLCFSKGTTSRVSRTRLVWDALVGSNKNQCVLDDIFLVRFKKVYSPRPAIRPLNKYIHRYGHWPYWQYGDRILPSGISVIQVSQVVTISAPL